MHNTMILDRGTLQIERVCQPCGAEIAILDPEREITQFTGRVVVLDTMGGVNELPSSEGRGDGLSQGVRVAGGGAPGDSERSTDRPTPERGGVVRGLPDGGGFFGDLGHDLGKSRLDLPPVRGRSLRERLRDRWIGFKIWMNEVYFQMICPQGPEVKRVDVRRVPRDGR